ncbi:MAG: FGGY family carbohydrate kinase, partial [Elainellaceae cyanobacterium]
MTNHPTTHVMALDLGTTGNRAIIFDRSGQIAGQAYKELHQSYPQPGWVEHDPVEIWQAVRWAMQAAVKDAGVEASQIAAVGLTVQRETCLLWDKTTGEPLHPAIVWQDRRTAPLCQKLRQAGHVEKIYDRTGLVLDAYFSATKLAWLIDWVKQNRPSTNWDNVLAGTVDTWALWNLTGRQVHATDHSNASRTMLLNLGDRTWDSEMLDLFGIPPHIMPSVQPSLSVFGHTDAD